MENNKLLEVHSFKFYKKTLERRNSLDFNKTLMLLGGQTISSTSNHIVNCKTNYNNSSSPTTLRENIVLTIQNPQQPFK